MWTWVKELDRILRGEATRPEALRDGSIEVPIVGLSVVILLLGLIYGACMGCYAQFRTPTPGEQSVAAYIDSYRHVQILASTLKVPALFALTLVVTFPSLYVFNALVGSRLTLVPVMQLLIASLGVNLAVLASLGPIVVFFSVTTMNYSFIVLLNVFVFAVSGVLGLLFLIQTLNRLTLAPAESHPVAADPDNQPEEADPSGEEPLLVEQATEPGALDRIEGHVLGRHVKAVFRCWVILFALVGAQMGWVLRPFIGSPGEPFQWFRQRESNFFEAIREAVAQLILGG